MSTNATYRIQQLCASDEPLMDSLLEVFGEAFENQETYGSRRPSGGYLRKLLDSDYFVALIAKEGEMVIGGLAAYELKKFEQERSEFYIYDLAVAASHRRKGVATALIRELQRIAAERRAYVIFVQADPCDAAAISLYSKLGIREDVLHFDIPVAHRRIMALAPMSPSDMLDRGFNCR
jgi:aminoglycoside 3-N-acetyltransferase I